MRMPSGYADALRAMSREQLEQALLREASIRGDAELCLEHLGHREWREDVLPHVQLPQQPESHYPQWVCEPCQWANPAFADECTRCGRISSIGSILRAGGDRTSGMSRRTWTLVRFDDDWRATTSGRELMEADEVVEVQEVVEHGAQPAAR